MLHSVRKEIHVQKHEKPGDAGVLSVNAIKLMTVYRQNDVIKYSSYIYYLIILLNESLALLPMNSRIAFSGRS